MNDIIAYLIQYINMTCSSWYLYLFPSLGNLEEETSSCCDVRQSSLCIPDGVLHHTLTGRKRFQLKNKDTEHCAYLWKL